MRKLLVLLSAVAFVVAFALPAMASDWNFYGSARVGTFFEDDCVPAPGYDDKDFTHALQGNARVGATVKGGPVGGRFEYGVTGQTTGSHYAARVRRLYGTWNFGAGTLKVGRDYTPVTTLYSDQVFAGDNGLLGFGMPYAGRQGQVAIQVKGLKVALITPTTASIIAGSVEQDTSIPKIEASYDFKAGPAGVGVFLGMNSYDDVNAANTEVGVDSMAYGFRAKMNFGAAFVKLGAYMGENLGVYGWSGGGTPSATGTTINDSDDMGYFLLAGFKASDTIALQVGYGYSERERDVSGEVADESVSYYLQAKIDFAKNVFIVPEFGKFDYKEDANGADQGDTTYYGAKWQINF
jgi:hypothetical protein